jgi:plastocyanin
MKVSSWKSVAAAELALPAMLALVLSMVTAGALLVNRGEARAANSAVTVGSPQNRFSPNVTTIAVGDSVTFNWAAGTHVVDLEDVSPDIPIDSGHTTGTTMAFTSPGTYYYYCSIHASEALATEAHVQANDAMVGKIVVTAAQTTPTASPTTPAATATTPPATTTSAPGSTTTATAPTATATAPAVTATAPAATATLTPGAPATGSGYAGASGDEVAAIVLIAGACLVLVGATAFAIRR